MLNSLRLAMALLLFTLALYAQDINPSEKDAARKNPCDWARTQKEMNQCSDEEYRKSDARLNTLYGKLSGLIEKDIAVARQRSDADEKKHNEAAMQKLKAAQGAWLRYRDLQCDAARHQFEGGSVSPMVWADCMAMITNHRVEELKDAYGTTAGKLE